MPERRTIYSWKLSQQLRTIDLSGEKRGLLGVKVIDAVTIDSLGPSGVLFRMNGLANQRKGGWLMGVCGSNGRFDGGLVNIGSRSESDQKG